MIRKTAQPTIVATLLKDIYLLASPKLEGGWLELKDAYLVIDSNQIAFIGSKSDFESWLSAHPTTFEETVDARHHVVLPGFVNCHHHLYQSLTRSIGTGEGKALFDWLKFLYPIWGRLTPEAVFTSAKLALAELMLSGCTTVADHLYIFPDACRLDDEIAAAKALGVRFHPTRGSMSLGEAKGGLPPDYLVEEEDAILEDSQRLIERYHDPDPLSMLRIGLAPCSPFSVTPDLMKASAELARSYNGVRLHTHLAETADETDFCLSLFNKRPLEYADSLGWTGDDVWFAHMVHPNSDEIKQLACTASGVCHCPSSNMILASGTAPIRKMLDEGVRVGLGVDGSASNDSGHILAEARQAMLLQRVGYPGFVSSADRFSAREALRLATLGGAEVLGRQDIGRLELGLAADIVGFRVDDIYHAGALSDPLAALLTCHPVDVDFSFINGQLLIEDGSFDQLDLEPLIAEHNRLSKGLIQGGG